MAKQAPRSQDGSGWITQHVDHDPLICLDRKEPLEYLEETWGENSLFIEAWFEEGEALQYSEEEIPIDEPVWMERFLSWLRSLVIATRMRLLPQE